MEEVNRRLEVCHPDNPAFGAVELVMLYEKVDRLNARDIVISRAGGIDRSPCGAGTGARVTDLFTKEKLKMDEEYCLESFLGTQFVGRVLEALDVGSFRGALPEIRGSPYITGKHRFILEPGDPLLEELVV